jgi:hypothetical protein
MPAESAPALFDYDLISYATCFSFSKPGWEGVIACLSVISLQMHLLCNSKNYEQLIDISLEPV